MIDRRLIEWNWASVRRPVWTVVPFSNALAIQSFDWPPIKGPPGWGSARGNNPRLPHWIPVDSLGLAKMGKPS